jgi:hypothetical protein
MLHHLLMSVLLHYIPFIYLCKYVYVPKGNYEGGVGMITDVDLKHLRRCVELARMALEKGDEPFGSVLVSAEDEVLFEDHNHVAGGDQTQHPVPGGRRKT